MSDLDLDDILSRADSMRDSAAQAMPEPWTVKRHAYYGTLDAIIRGEAQRYLTIRACQDSDDWVADCGRRDESERVRNALFIAASRSDVPWAASTIAELVGEIKRLTAENKDLWKVRQDHDALRERVEAAERLVAENRALREVVGTAQTLRRCLINTYGPRIQDLPEFQAYIEADVAYDVARRAVPGNAEKEAGDPT